MREHEPPRHIPIGLAIIANVLLREGHEVKVLDINAERLSKSEVKERIALASQYPVIGTGGLITTYKYLNWLIPELKASNPQSTVVVGGAALTENPTRLLTTTPADIAVIGEGEITMAEIVSVLEGNGALDAVKGIAYKNGDGQVTVNPPRPLIEDLDTLPLPAYDLFPMDIYVRNVAHAWIVGKKTEMSLITARGCPYNCHYCFHIFGRGARTRTIGNVIAEMKHLIGKYGVESFIILDETFAISKKRVMAFCDTLLDEGIRMPWSCSARVNLVDWEMLRKMKRAGCYRISYGIESGSQKILDNMHKQVSVEQAHRAIALTRKAGIVCGTTFMFGYPGEDMDTIEETIQFCRKSLITPSQMFFTTPYPGCRLYEETRDRIVARYGDEASFIEVLGDAYDFTINLTDFADDELLRLKKRSERMVRKLPVHRYPRFVYLWYKQLGLRLLAKHAVRRLWRWLVERGGVRGQTAA